MRMGEHDDNYLWLRQSVTFTTGGQTRTLEIAIPVRRGSTPDEIETMLDEADAGMARLSRRLDAHVAGQAPSSAPARQMTAAEAPSETPTPTPKPAATQPAAHSPAPTAITQPAASAPPPAARPERPATPASARPTPTPASTRPTASASAADVTAPQAPMTIPQFIAAIGELGLNPKQAMDRLSVRTLSGLNLREALETLRRQMLRDEPAAPVAPPSPPAAMPSTPPSASAPARPAPAPAAPPSAQFFEEEDDFTFGLDDDEALEDDDTFTPTPSGAASYSADEYGSGAEDEPALPGEDDFDLLADLPDFDALAQPPAEPEPAPPSRTSARTAATRPANGAATHATPAPMPAGPSGPLAGPEHARALRRIGQLRGAQGGGTATPYQRNAYKNLVVEQLGETAATSLVRGLWRTTPAQLTGDQLDALKSWAKEDAFTEDVPLVLEALRAERARAARESDATGAAPGGAPEATRPPQSRRASGSRGEPAGGR